MLGDASIRDVVLGIAILIGSVIIHENAHGLVALWLGDRTAKNAGRLTLNPVKHLDPVGSLILPLAMYLSTRSMFGYARPVPVNPRNLRGTDRWGFATVALAGPVSNMILAFIAAVLLPDAGTFLDDTLANKALVFLFEFNVLMAAFNLLPIPPLDGSRLLRPFLSNKGRQTLDRIEPYGFLILLGLIFFLDEPLFRIVSWIENQLLRFLPI